MKKSCADIYQTDRKFQLRQKENDKCENDRIERNYVGILDPNLLTMSFSKIRT
jgi:hypothetical protein